MVALHAAISLPVARIDSCTTNPTNGRLARNWGICSPTTSASSAHMRKAMGNAMAGNSAPLLPSTAPHFATSSRRGFFGETASLCITTPGKGGDSKSRQPTIRRQTQTRTTVVVTTARLFGPAVFEAQKLNVQFLGAREDQHPAHAPQPRMYTFTHSDITSKLTLAVAHEFNKVQFMGWYSRLQRDEVLAVWRRHSNKDNKLAWGQKKQQEQEEELSVEGGKIDPVGYSLYSELPEGTIGDMNDHATEREEAAQAEVLQQHNSTHSVPAGGPMTLHVHCHISGGHVWLDWIAKVRFWIFKKELPVVLEAFRHGDRTLLDAHPELDNSVVVVHYHSNLPQYNFHECWGPLYKAARVGATSAEGYLREALCNLEVAMHAHAEHVWPFHDHLHHQYQRQHQNHFHLCGDEQEQEQLQQQQQHQQQEQEQQHHETWVSPSITIGIRY